MPSGGPRPGAGRKKGQKLNPERQRMLKRVRVKANADITPLEVLLETMRKRWHDGKEEEACRLAVDAAPYVHPKLATVKAEITDNRTVSDLTDAELEHIIRSASRSTGDAGAAEGEVGPDSLH